jgi:uncharacterized protein RhaS with RHS repeats
MSPGLRPDGPNPAVERTSTALADGSYCTYSYDALGQATVTGADPRRLEFLYDAKGRRRSRTLYAWDAQAQTWTLSETRTFVYDGQGRRRTKTEYSWDNGQWVLLRETRYIWDGTSSPEGYAAAGWLCLQHRIDEDGETATETYLRGLDLSGSLEGAGGIRLRTSVDSGATARHVGGLPGPSPADTHEYFICPVDSSFRSGSLK